MALQKNVGFGISTTGISRCMGQAKIRQRAAFATDLIEGWEANDCVDFAVALARMTGWLLHVDWLSNSTEHQADISTDKLRPLRVYVANNSDQIFDVRGVKSIFDYTERTIRPLVIKMHVGNGGVYTRFYEEEHLADLPLRAKPDEGNIEHATKAISANSFYLGAIPPRLRPSLPAYQAARFTYGRCAAYAEAMRELTGLQPVALLAKRFAPAFEGTKRSANGYVHSLVLHPDGLAEDSWGKAPLRDIAERFGVVDFITSEEAHRSAVASIRSTSDDLYLLELREAMDLIRMYRL